jgi:hypothetical protein
MTYARLVSPAEETISRISRSKPPEMKTTDYHQQGRRMEADKSGPCDNADLYAQCLASIEADQIDSAKRQARRIEAVALQTIAQDQIRFVLEIKVCLANGDQDQARRLSQSLIGGIKRKYEVALGNRPVSRTWPPPSSRSGAKKPCAGKEDHRPRPDFTDFPPEIRSSLIQLMERIGRARLGGRHLEFSPAVLLQLGWIAHRAWRRSSTGRKFSPFRADASEIRVTGACLRQRIERDDGRLSIEDLSRELGLSQGRICRAVRDLRQFLLRESGWRMVGDAKTGFALEPEDPNILPADLLHDAGGAARDDEH